MFGFGESTGIDLPRESTGILYDVENMDSASLATNAFGQNFNVTMTQLGASFCSLINGGDYYKPHVVRQIWDENGDLLENKNPVVLRRTVSKETSDILKDYMLYKLRNGIEIDGRETAPFGKQLPAVVYRLCAAGEPAGDGLRHRG